MLISCVCPTYNRPHFIPSAVKWFQHQDYRELELIIVDSGESVRHLVPKDDPRITYVHSDTRLSCGQARNLGTQHAKGELVLMHDDDDYYSPERVRLQTKFHLESGKAVTGYDYIFLHNLTTGEFNRYKMPDSYLCGTCIMFTRSYWANVERFEECNTEDVIFSHNASKRNELARNSDDKPITIVASTHGTNTWPREPLTQTGQAWTIEQRPEGYYLLP